ncbi:unnamed protein product [Parajaminaea phylloscopi]
MALDPAPVYRPAIAPLAAATSSNQPYPTSFDEAHARASTLSATAGEPVNSVAGLAKRKDLASAEWQHESPHDFQTSDAVDHADPRVAARFSAGSPSDPPAHQSMAVPQLESNMNLVNSAAFNALTANGTDGAAGRSTALSASPSDLAAQIQSLRLSESNGPAALEPTTASETGAAQASAVDNAQHSPEAIVQGFKKAYDGIDAIKRTLFQLEELRHSNASSSSDQPPASGPSNAESLELTVVQVDEQLEGLSSIIEHLETQVSDAARAGDTAVDDHDSDSDDADFSMPGLSLKDTQRRPQAASAYQSQFQELSQAWSAVRSEVDTLKRELADDRYISHFSSASTQAGGLMDSLEKALSVCNDFVLEFNAFAISMGSNWTADEEDAAEEVSKMLQRLAAVKKAFVTKRNYYTPACEQTLAAFERSFKDRGTSHGMLVRTFSELQGRWADLRQRTSATSKQLKRVEVRLKDMRDGGEQRNSPNQVANTELRQLETESQASQSPARPGASNPARRESPVLPLRSKMRENAGRVASATQTPPQHGVVGAGPSRSPAVPPKPVKSPRRLASGQSPSSATIGLPTSSSASSLSLAKASMPPLTPSRHHRSASASLSPEPGLLLRARERNPSVRAGDPRSVSGSHLHQASPLGRPPSDAGTADPPPSPARRTPHLSASKPPSSYRLRAGSIEPTDVPRRFVRAGSEPPVAAEAARPLRPASVLGASGVQLSPDRTGRLNYSTTTRNAHSMAMADEESSMEIMAPSSRPGSAAGMHMPWNYRPPSAATTHVDPSLKAARRQSRIPTLSFAAGSASEAGSYDHPARARPSSSLSQASNSRLHGASRSTMQTPEPMIAARVQRLSVFSKPSTGAPSTSVRATNRRVTSGAGSVAGNGISHPSSRPPTTRSNPRSTAAGVLTGSQATSRPGSLIAGSSRTTPLSASALAKIPHADPAYAAGGGSIYSPSVSGSSVTNYRLSRYGAFAGPSRVAPSAGPGSIRDGAVTPTLSESGFSAYSGIGSGRPGQSGAFRPNPNDALDVEISQIVNSLGVPLTRIDPPLPRGAKTETGPGKEVRCRYAFGGGSAMTCKLLELHRPSVGPSSVAAGGSGQSKQRKVLVKVPGRGFMDLELWLLSSLD